MNSCAGPCTHELVPEVRFSGHGKLLLWSLDSGYAALVGWHAHWYMGSLVVRKAPSEGGGHVLKPDEI